MLRAHLQGCQPLSLRADASLFLFSLHFARICMTEGSFRRKKRDVRIWVSTVFLLISLKTEIARSVKGPKLQGPHAEDAMAKPYLVLKNLVDLITADHKVPPICSRGAGPSHPMDPGVSVLKPKLHKKPRDACKSSWNPRGNQKSFTLTIPWNSAKLVKISPGIIARLHHTDRRLMGLLKEQCAE